MSNLNSTFETNDFDSFLNLENDFTSPANHTLPSSLSHQSSSTSQPAFSGPSYQYDSHRQQTGLPMGGLANTFAVNQASGLHYRPNNLGFVMPTETLNIPLSNLDDFDFGRSQADMNDMDFDADSPSDFSGVFYGAGSSQIKTESTQSTPIQRIYPGMHSQQAAQAKQRQQEMLRQQQQQPKQLPGQLPLPTQAPKAAKDPHVEESISRLLSRMRQSSTSSVDESTPAPSGMSNMPRSRKDEEDMDEDERLLASEEGKKLSSKERRQLRNKVSARAFRSRRKEYIGQLEGEVAAKVQEANDLRIQNRQLMEENTRLTDLTRMLLSSQAFSGFLQELSNSGMTMPSTVPSQQTQQQQAPPQPKPRQSRKDVPIHEAARQLQGQNQQQVGMTLIPETNFDVSDFSNNWNVTVPSNDFQVFAVSAMPELPVLNLEALCEKKTSSILPSTPVKRDAPELPSLPPPVEVENSGVTESCVDQIVDVEAATDLYAPRSTSTVTTHQSVESLLESIKKPVAIAQLSAHLVAENEEESSANLERMCSALEESSIRLEKFLP